ncbi:MAG TPA: hypothetical protein PKK61_09720 [Defluviitaleaceae bacterium]|nr:hypothetical protein [Defluviitaleaceae bacterium]
MKIKRIYFFIGICLVAGMYFTKIDSIDKDSLNLIERAREMDLEQKLWPEYKLSKYPIDVNYGSVEFRYDNGEIIRQKPTLEVLAFTAYPEENGSVIKVLPKSMLRQAINIMGDISNKEIEHYYIASLFHEGFHAFQFENSDVFDIEKSQNISEEFMNILYILDHDEKYQNLWLEEERALVDYYKKNDKEAWLIAYNKRTKYLKEILGDDYDFYMEMENEKELIEGTAKYIEDKVLDILRGAEKEIESLDLYQKGLNKFYERGRLKCLILDKDKAWKENLFNLDITLTDLLL